MYAIKNNKGACRHGKLDDEPGCGSFEKAKRHLRRDEAQKAANAILSTYSGELTVCSM